MFMAHYIEKIADLKPENMVYIDESGIDTYVQRICLE
jgi:hypothetical protein